MYSADQASRLQSACPVERGGRIRSREDETATQRQKQGTGASPEQCTPGGVPNRVQVNDGGDEVSCGVPPLHNTTNKITSLDREVFEGGGRG